MNEITSIISTVGFPIVACLGVAFYVKEDNKARREENIRREERYLNTIDKFGDSLDRINNTMLAMDKRLELLERERNENK